MLTSRAIVKFLMYLIFIPRNMIWHDIYVLTQSHFIIQTMKYKTLLLLLLVSMTALETHGALFFVRKMNPIQTKTKVDPKIFWLDLKSKWQILLRLRTSQIDGFLSRTWFFEWKGKVSQLDYEYEAETLRREMNRSQN